MDTILILAIGLAAFGALASSAMLARSRSQTRENAALHRELADSRADAIAHLRDKAEAETLLAAQDARLAETRKSQELAEEAYAEAHATREVAVRDAALARQHADSVEARMRDWEATKAESMEAAKAAAFKTVSDMSNKLLEDHKRESARTKRESEEQVKKTTETLTMRFKESNEAVASMRDQVTQNDRVLNTVWQALSSPGGAGYFAEIGLENTLKSFGLEAGRDFVMQFNVTRKDGGRLRPDAVVFLPGESILVIDSKASKFLLELAAAENEAAAEEATVRLATTMNQHLKELSAKDYRSSILETYKQAGRGNALSRVISVMYLPNEGALEKLTLADPNFPKKAALKEILPAGPAGLASIISLARVEIDRGRQAANHEHIATLTEDMLAAVAVLLKHVDGVGTSIRSSAERFAKLAGSVNSNLLPKTRTIASMGVRPAKSKTLPANVPAYRVERIDEGRLIEGEAAELPMPNLEVDG